jgi:hypothetical protein
LILTGAEMHLEAQGDKKQIGQAPTKKSKIPNVEN